MSGIGVIVGASVITLALEPFIHKLSQLVKDEGSSILYIKDDIDNLQVSYREIQSVLKHVQNNQVECDWLRQLVDIGYEARDVLDECYTVTAALVEKRKDSRSVSSPALSFCFCSSSATVKLPFSFRFRIANDIKNVNKRLDMIIKKQGEISKLKESVEGGGPTASTTTDSRPETINRTNKHKKNGFVGREKEKEEIIKKLLDDGNNFYRVVPIWGMGGIGKTTLARSIYNDGKVNEKYQNKFWLPVGEKNFNGKDIMWKIVGEQNPNVLLRELTDKLVEKLKEDKFLIVLDDVWGIESNEWELLWTTLNDVPKGGCIIITTRNKEVFTKTNTPVEEEGIKPLSDDDCWLIFESRAFVNGNSNDRLDLKKVGKEIVKKVKGLPLAAEVVGCSLLNEKNVKKWRDFLNIFDNEGTIKNALRWSYNRLDSHLKQCFAYCSLFPKDHVFHEKVLINMWMAHDFILMDEEKGTEEEIGRQYFTNLVNASFFQSVDGKYMMHDMIHDLALRVSNEEFTMVNGSPQNIDARHVSVVSYLYNRDNYLENLRLCKSKRILTIYTIDELENTWLHTSSFFDKGIFRDIFQQLKSIRVLVLVSSSIKDIPDCISNLIHLRYLDLNRTSVKSLPDRLCKLHNLQTLALPFYAVLPKNIVKMANLRHLRANLTIDYGFGKLTSLQELSSISIFKDTNIRELGNMPKQLHGELEIRGLENVTNLQDAGQGILKDQDDIDQLRLVREDWDKFLTEEVLNALSCPQNLTYLFIDGYNGLNFPNWMMEGSFFANLRTLKLSHWPGLKLCRFYGKFPLLEKLSLSHMWTSKKWAVDASVEGTRVSDFPCLKELDMMVCPVLVLVSIISDSNVMISLSKLSINTIFGGLTLLNVDAFVSLKYLWIYNCSNLTTILFGDTIEELQVYGCMELNRMDSESTSSLKKLLLRQCKELRSLGNMDLLKIGSLKDLTVLGCPELIFEETSTSSSPSTSLSILHTDNVVLFTKVFEYNNHVSLERMTISSFGFEHFSESVVNNWNKLTLLRYLEIFGCWNLKSLFPEFQNLPSLKELKIVGCHKLRLLPTDRLPLSLKSLHVINSKILCEQWDSEHSHKFKHIPNITIH